MPIDLRHAPAVFQSLISGIFHDVIDDFDVVFLHDILLHSNNREDLIRHYCLVLEHQ